MAYFECIIGGGGGGESDVNLIVTCSPNFAGKTITCTNGTDTYTQTCPSTSPYTVTFENIAKGTWTISGVISGQTFSQSVTIADYTAELNDIPEGATVTPVNDIQIWLHCANIWDKSYTTIAQVLADTTTLLALISSNNAADYMARSTSWASSVTANSTAMTYIGNNDYCADKLLGNSTWLNAICDSTYFESVLNVKVPTMTSNTTPSGEAFINTSANAVSDNPAYYAFDNNASTSCGWQRGATSIPLTSIGTCYDFGQNVKIYKYNVVNSITAREINMDIKASSDKSTWSNSLSTFNTSTDGDDVTKDITDNSNAYRYWGVFFNTEPINGVGGVAISKIQFYGRA